MFRVLIRVCSRTSISVSPQFLGTFWADRKGYGWYRIVLGGGCAFHPFGVLSVFNRTLSLYRPNYSYACFIILCVCWGDGMLWRGAEVSRFFVTAQQGGHAHHHGLCGWVCLFPPYVVIRGCWSPFIAGCSVVSNVCVRSSLGIGSCEVPCWLSLELAWMPSGTRSSISDLWLAVPCDTMSANDAVGGGCAEPPAFLRYGHVWYWCPTLLLP